VRGEGKLGYDIEAVGKVGVGGGDPMVSGFNGRTFSVLGLGK